MEPVASNILQKKSAVTSNETTPSLLSMEITGHCYHVL